MGKLRTAIEAANREFMDAFIEGDAGRVAALYTKNSRLLPPDNDMLMGSQAVESFWKSGMDMGLKSIELETVEVEGHGDTAYEIGKYKLMVKHPDGETTAETGKYLVVWKLEAGSWKLDVDIWNNSLPSMW